MAGVSSPSSSPRLPSPPPIAEDQIGSMSPGASPSDDQPLTLNTFDTGAARRVRRGTKAEDMHEGPPVVEIQDIDSAFQLTEHLKAIYHHYTHPPDGDTIVPVTPAFARQLAHPPTGASREIWLYELARFLIQKTNAIIVHLFADNPPCSPATCPEMRASEWQYLCAVHESPKSCAAIDYCCHTLDWAANSLTSSKMFPSRLGLGSGGSGGSDKMLAQQMKEITNIFRRVYRIYAHAWFQHREMFWRVENKTGLYILFKTVCDEYAMIQPENYTIPPEAEGHEPETAEQRSESDRPAISSILLRPVDDAIKPAENLVSSSGGTSKRHGHTRDHSSSVATVIQEEAEEDEVQDEAKPARNLDRSSTIFHANTEIPAEPVHEVREITHADDEPTRGINKRDTIRPELLESRLDGLAAEERATEEPMESAAAEANEVVDGSTNLSPDSHVELKDDIHDESTELKPDEPGVEVKLEPVQPTEVEHSPAADGDEAGKTVAD